MQIHTRPAATLAFLFLASCASPPAPPQQGVGSLLPAEEIEDQHGIVHTLDASIRLVIMSRDMEAGKVIRSALSEVGGDALERNHAVYVSDISGMPALIARMAAIPKMRKRPYPVLLDRDGTFTARFSAEPDKATVLVVDDRRIREIHYIDEVSDLVAMLMMDDG